MTGHKIGQGANIALRQGDCKRAQRPFRPLSQKMSGPREYFRSIVPVLCVKWDRGEKVDKSGGLVLQSHTQRYSVGQII